MKFITAEQFSKADKKVRDSIMEWWKPSYGDIFSWCSPTCNLDGSPHIQYSMQVFDDDVLSFYETDNFTDTVYRHQKRDFYVPLLTVGQLIEFIEWKTEYMLEGISVCCDQYWINPHDESDAKWYLEEKSFTDKDLLQALWKCAQGICE